MRPTLKPAVRADAFADFGDDLSRPRLDLGVGSPDGKTTGGGSQKTERSVIVSA
jgi:hypothetical protein